jgi:acetyl esterase
MVVDNMFRALARVGRLHPRANPERHNVEVVRDLHYLPTGLPEHRLDVYRPTKIAAPWPVVLYVHGGGFRILSKDTHWLLALAYARRGYLVFNISYRLAPRHPFPAGITDACAAYEWVIKHAPAYGGDLSRFMLAGESAGANLVTAMTMAACYERPELYARQVFETGVVPRVVLPACGIFQVSDTERFMRRKKLAPWIGDRLSEVEHAYLRGVDPTSPELEMANPLLVFERGDRPARTLPPFFLPVGTRDVLLDDTRRMKAALDALDVPCEARYYPGEVHAFHAMIFRKQARHHWQHAYDFIDKHL